jgi:hypothetical protein
MSSSTQNTNPTESQKRSIVESEDGETRANRLAADQMAEEVLEGFRQLAKQRLTPKAPH